MNIITKQDILKTVDEMINALKSHIKFLKEKNDKKFIDYNLKMLDHYENRRREYELYL